MTIDPSDVDDEGWREWTDVAATDLADPEFVALVTAINADQESWATE
jgi:hypothetical protein